MNAATNEVYSFTQQTRLDKIEQTSDTLVASKAGDLPRFTFAVTRGDHYLALTLKRVEGIPAKSLTSLHFEMLCTASLLPLKIDPMVSVEIRGGSVCAEWGYLWHHSPNDPLGGFAILCRRRSRQAR